MRDIGEALGALVDASAGEMFVPGDATPKVRSEGPLPLERP